MTLSVARSRGPAGTIAFVSVMSAACTRQLPPAATPAVIPPPVDVSAPLPAGHGRLVVDVVDGPTPVQRIQMASQPIADDQGRVRYRLFEAPVVLCPASPCVLEMPAGNALLSFPVRGDPGAAETELVHVAEGTGVYRRALSEYTPSKGGLKVTGIISTSVGGTAMMAGAVFLPIGLAEDIDGLTIAGGVSLGVGAALVAFGIWALRRDAATFRSGAANHYTLDVR